MKKTSGILSVCATLALLSLPVLTHNAYAAGEDALQDTCTADAKATLYAEIYKELRGDQAKAKDLAKKYVACPGEGADDAEMKRVEFLKGFIAKYEKAHRKDQLTEQLNKKDYTGAFETAKAVFADDPSYLKGYMALALAGAISQNQAVAGDTVTYAQKAISLIEAGTTPDSWAPFDNKDDALAKLNYAVGSLKVAASPDEAIPYLIKAASYNSKIKSTPLTYVYLADAYERGPYAKQSAEYKTKFTIETPESKLALENINQIIDREIDAYARAVALGASEANKAAWMTQLTDLYKFRHDKSDAGLNDMIAGVLAKPLPPLPTPLTELPATATPAAGAPAAGTATTAPAGATTPPNGSSMVKPAVTSPAGTSNAKPAATPAAGSTNAKPAATPVKPPASPGKPRARKAHPGH